MLPASYDLCLLTEFKCGHNFYGKAFMTRHCCLGVVLPKCCPTGLGLAGYFHLAALLAGAKYRVINIVAARANGVCFLIAGIAWL